MTLQEKKYRVDSFDEIFQLLKKKNAKKIKRIESIHYYGNFESNDVEKFIEYEDRSEVHILKESNGNFTLTKKFKIADKNVGILWLKNRGYKSAGIVKMNYTEYEYKNGTVGLYVLNDLLNSVILYFPSNKLEEMEKKFKLSNAEVIKVPYNKYLEKIGQLKQVNL